MSISSNLARMTAMLAAVLAFGYGPSTASAQQPANLLTGPSPGTLPNHTAFTLQGYGQVIVSWGAPPGGSYIPNAEFRDFPSLDGRIILDSPTIQLDSDVRLITFRTPESVTSTKVNKNFRVTIRFMNGAPDLNRLHLYVYNLGRLAPNSTGAPNGSFTTVVPNWVVPVYGATFRQTTNTGTEDLQMVNGVISQNPSPGSYSNSGIANFPFASSAGTLPAYPGSSGVVYTQLTINQNWNDEFAISLGYERAPATCQGYPLSADVNLFTPGWNVVHICRGGTVTFRKTTGNAFTVTPTTPALSFTPVTLGAGNANGTTTVFQTPGTYSYHPIAASPTAGQIIVH